ncbi:hypothetical protein MHU86_18844 [Fragilaria crotonensis]|nr:hypothetical protein MHU86_18844 [Fragilaria crotonensis]
MSQVKDNANPTIHSVTVTRRKCRKELIDFQRWQEGGLVLHALQLNAPKRTAAHGTDVSAVGTTDADMNMNHIKLLQNAGLQFPPPSSIQASQRNPFFIPSSQHRMQQQRHFQQSAMNKKNGNDHDQGINSDDKAVERELMDEDEIFDMIRNIQDPEHPLTLEQLNVVNRNHITVHDSGCNTKLSTVHVRFTPTIPHCSMATLIGLSLRVKLGRSLPSRFAIRVQIQPGTHASEHAINKQLSDKERVTAALENAHLLGVVNKCIGNGMTGNMQV